MGLQRLLNWQSWQHKEMTPATFAVSHGGAILQLTILFEWIERVVSIGPVPHHVHVDVGASNWQSTASLIKLVGHIDKDIQRDHVHSRQQSHEAVQTFLLLSGRQASAHI
eukprot:1711504-Amphidinium_carterae.1